MKVVIKYSPQDEAIFKSHKWYINGRGYAIATDDSKVSLHRLVMGSPKASVDHANGNKLDNRRENLRVCNQSQNCANSQLSKNNKSGYKGVSWNKALRKWHAYIMVNRKKKHLGYFSDKLQAAKAYNLAAQEYFADYAKLNKVAL